MPVRTDHDAFLCQLQEHRAILYKVANAYCAHRADRGDLIQDIVLELWRAYPRFDGRAAFSTWMYQVAVNIAISRHRGESRRVRDALPIEMFGMDLRAADAAMERDEEDLFALHQLIRQLDDVNRALILLYVEGYGHDEIAHLLGLTPTNVATRVHRIKQQLQQAYAATEESA